MMRNRNSLGSALLAYSVLTLTACQEQEPPTTLPSDDGDSGGSGSGSGSGGAEQSAGTPDPSPLSRLTTEQYKNTVLDLFPGVEMPSLLFPPQLEAEGGFENNATFNSASGPLVDAYNRAAIAVSEEVTFDLGCNLGDDACAHGYIAQLSERTWRRPIEPSELETLIADYDRWAASHGADTAMRLTIQSLLQSPDFIYFPRFGEAMSEGASASVPLSSWEMASRLSYFLWNTMPDDELFTLAREDGLRERDVVIAQAWRMLSEQRARTAAINLHRQLFDLDEQGAIDFEYYAPQIGGDSDFYYLEYLPEVRYEPDVFVMQHIFEGEGTLAALLTSNRAWVTANTAELAYGVEVPADAPSVRYVAPDEPLVDFEGLGVWQRDYYEVELNPAQRAGLFTLAGFLSSKSNPRDPSPVKRGVMLLERLQCVHLSPPGDVPPIEEIEDAMPRTNRDKYIMHSEAPACVGCHQQIDGLGFTFENYDSLGAWRDTDNGYPVDASGALVGTDNDGPVNNAVEMMDRLAQSRTIHDCYVRQLFRHSFGRNEDVVVDGPTLEFLQEGFWQSGGDIPELLVNIAASYEFRHREVFQP
ncbi:MAG: DUF1588 domain-containing protein [Myxococcota bacterium]